MITQSRRLAAVQAPVIPVISQWIAETPGTISLGQGIVSYGPPRAALEAAGAFAAGARDHAYGPIEGEPELLAAIEDKLCCENGITVRPASHVVVTRGCNLAFMHAMLATVDVGDEVVLPAPYYFNHEMAIQMAGARVVAVPTTSTHALDADAIARAIGPRTRAVVTVSPNNPTGAVYDAASLRALNDLCRARGIYHVHDETYEYFTYDGATHVSPGSFEGAAAHTISLYSLSKAYGMAGWRIGYMVAPAHLREALAKIQDTLLICATVVAQRAAVAALHIGRSHADAHRPALDATRRLLRDTLSAPGLPCDVPAADGAFYVFPRVRTPLDSLTLTERLIREHRVAVVPGSAFGDAGGCSIRVSYGALETATAAEGLQRLANGLRALAGALVMMLAAGWLR